MRLFVAVPVTEEIKDALRTAQVHLATLAEGTGVRVRWVEPENYHLTVAFLGELTENVVPDLSDACAAIAAGTPAFRVAIAGLSVFPKPRGKMSSEIKTIWVGLTTGSEAWRELARRAEPWFVPFGAAREGGLVPHITLGRVKSERNASSGDHAALRAALERESSAPFGSQIADRLTLIESKLDPRGATYREINHWTFGPAAPADTETEEYHGSR
ncbi:MAG: RNA 2',3'-cyclic phosphodiesterase [Capsulimonadales bacterium]|nr:RNA 2',3'-cyclic phosphodiesterase [Capsulimonadales bacterium]